MKKCAPSLLLTLLALAGLLSIGGCSLGRSPRPDFYMLSSPVENVVLSGKEKISGPRVAIGPVSIPGYLDRPQLFLRDGNDVKVELAEFNHWSEPFGEGVTRVLCDAVSASCHLSPREDEICRLIASGKTNQQIERELFIASGTLKAHIQHIYVKCGVHSRKELIALCGGE